MLSDQHVTLNPACSLLNSVYDTHSREYLLSTIFKEMQQGNATLTDLAAYSPYRMPQPSTKMAKMTLLSTVSNAPKEIFMLPYFCLPSHILTLLQGNSHALHLLSVFCAHRSIETNNTKFLSTKKMVELSGISRREVYNCIDELTNFGLIEEVTNLKGERMYHLPFLNEFKAKTDTDTDTDSDKDTITPPPGWQEWIDQLEEEDKELSLKEQLKEMNPDEE